MTPFAFSILTPSGTRTFDDAVFVGVRTVEGALGVLAKHAPMIAACPAGVVRVQNAEGWNYFAASAGILTTDGTLVSMLSGYAEPADSEDAARATVESWQREMDAESESDQAH